MPFSKREVFLSFSELIAAPRSKLSEEQRTIIAAHLAAKRAWAKFLASGHYRAIGIMYVGDRPVVSDREVKAAQAGTSALERALAYYCCRGRFQEAYRDLKEAAVHWHPAL